MKISPNTDLQQWVHLHIKQATESQKRIFSNFVEHREIVMCACSCYITQLNSASELWS